MEKKYDIVYGKHACMSVLQNRSRKINEILLLDRSLLANEFLEEYGSVIKITDKKKLDKVAGFSDKHQGIVMKIGQLIEKIGLADLVGGVDEDDFCYGLMLDRVQDPHNVGAIVRSAYCFGVSFVIVCKNEAPPINSSVIRSSAGYSEVLPIYTAVNMARQIEMLKQMGFWVAGLDNNHLSDDPGSVISKSAKRLIFVLGGEGSGMRELTKKCCDLFIKIPMIESAESLNVSNAATIISYAAYLNKIK